MDLADFNALDNRRLEVVADGLTLWRGAQLAVDTTLVSPLCRDGSARRRAAHHDGQRWEQLARGKKTHILNLPGKVAGRGRAVEQRDSSVPVFPCQSTSAECAFGAPGKDGVGLAATVERNPRMQRCKIVCSLFVGPLPVARDR